MGTGTCTPLSADNPAVLVHRMEAQRGSVLFVHNLGDGDATVDLAGQDGEPVEVFADQTYDAPDLASLTVGPRGFRWLRLSGS